MSHSQAELPPIDEVPAAHLEGRQLEDGWTVAQRITRPAGATGGYFSISYTAEHTSGEVAFLKALNIAKALHGPGLLIDRLKAFSDAHAFEATILRDCRARRLTRVVQLISEGQVLVPEAGVLQEVPYLIFERADGDIRAFQEQVGVFDFAWTLRTMKHVSLAVEQLHGSNTTHQDLKPSNVLTQSGGSEMKVGDLGQAERKGVDGPTSAWSIPGAVAYAPPEQIYGAFTHGWEERRAADLYLLGSLGLQLFLQHNATTTILTHLHPSHRPDQWGGGFDACLPYLEHAHAKVNAQFEASIRRECGLADVVEEFSKAVFQMTHPNPAKRGHPKARPGVGSNYDVRRYVSLFDRLEGSVRRRIGLT